MVKIAFITEGETEKILLDSKSFRSWCKKNQIEICDPVIDAKGSGNLLPDNINTYIARLEQEGPDKIIIVTDLERDKSVTIIRNKIANPKIDFIAIAVKAVEAWFLADSAALSSWLNNTAFEIRPQDTTDLPWARLKEISKQYKVKGPGSSKPIFANKYITKHGFSLDRSASHPYCQSAAEFLDILIAYAAIGHDP